ncbi:MAG: elongation factor G [candidate division KSB1 bacterium]|nr:elongation factor G [candidate division KSB1 bacterium]
MKDYAPQDIRNIGLVSHQSIGKTTAAEAMLYSAGVTNRFGSIDEGNTTSDYRADEIERKISLGASLIQFEWDKHKINLIDMPGYADFIGEARCGLRVTDLAVLLLNGVNGVEVGTDIVWEILQEYNLPRIFFTNLLDREHADFDKVLNQVREAYGNEVIAFQFPVNQGESFNSVIDVLSMKQLTFQEDNSGNYKEEDIPSDLSGRAEELHTELVEKIAESDDALLETYFENGELTTEQLITGLKTGLKNRTIFPLLCGAASKNMGINPLLDFIKSYAPSPVDMPPVQALDDSDNAIEVECDENKDFSALVFKTIAEKHVGELSLVRAFSGSISQGNEVDNKSRGITERIGQMYALCGKNRSEVGAVKAGDIGALVKLKDTHTGNSLVSKGASMKFPPITFADPVVQVAVSPKIKGEEEKISNGLHTLHEIDPSFTVNIDAELHQTVVSGQGELHLNIILERLKERYGVEVETKKPKIPYRETITTPADEKYRHKKQSGGAGQFAEVWMKIEPQPRGEGFEFESTVVGGAISNVFIPSIEKGIKQVLIEGIVAGYQVVDVKANVYDGKEHPVDSKDIAFQIAGREVFKQAFKKAKPILLEPIYNIVVKCPEESMGDVMGDLSSRRGKIGGMETQGHFQLINAKVPLAELHNYATTLRLSPADVQPIHARFHTMIRFPRKWKPRSSRNLKSKMNTNNIFPRSQGSGVFIPVRINRRLIPICYTSLIAPS